MMGLKRLKEREQRKENRLIYLFFCSCYIYTNEISHRYIRTKLFVYITIIRAGLGLGKTGWGHKCCLLHRRKPTRIKEERSEAWMCN